MRFVLIATMLTFLVFSGCGSGKLETGYAPRKIGASPAERRGFYASPFTPQAQAAQVERDDEVDVRRPRPGY